MPEIFYLQLICCGRDEGIVMRRTWRECDELRASYAETGGSHERVGIIRSVAALSATNQSEDAALRSLSPLGLPTTEEKQ